MSVRIASVISTLDRCGPVNVLYDLVRHALSVGDEPVVLTLASEPSGSRREDFEALGVPVHCVASSRVAVALDGRRRLLRELGRLEPDVVHAHGFRAYQVCRSLGSRGLPTVATVHNELYADFAQAYGPIVGWWMTRSELRDLRRFDAVVACSRAGADVLAQRYGLVAQCIRNGVDPRVYAPPSPEERRDLRRRLGYDPDTTILVSTGGCTERKGTEALIRAFGRAARGTGAQLHVLGGGPRLRACRDLAVPGVFLHGFVDDVTAHLRAADLFVSASSAEGMPLAVLEALSCGLPALLSSIAPHEEVAGLVQGQGGAPSVLGFDATRPQSIEEALRRALVGSGGPRPPRDTAALSSARMGREYGELYRRLARRGGGA